MMMPAELINATLTKKHVYVISGLDVIPVTVVAVVATAKPDFSVILEDGTRTNLIETEFFASRKGAKYILSKTLNRINRKLNRKLN